MEEDKTNLLSVFFEDESNGDQSGAGLSSSELTEKIIGCAFAVGNKLGCGFLEKVYENALSHKLRKGGFQVSQQQKVDVIYDGICVGFYEADIAVDGRIITEVKAVRSLEDAHKAECLNYLTATGIRLGPLINFGTTRVEVKRVAL